LAEASADISIDPRIGFSPTASAHPNMLTLVSFFGYVKRQNTLPREVERANAGIVWFMKICTGFWGRA
jgi:hypothetical protein